MADYMPEKNDGGLSDMIGQGSKTIGAGVQGVSWVRNAVKALIALIVLGYFVYKGVPAWIGLLFGVIIIGVFALSAWRIKRMATADLNVRPRAGQTSAPQLEIASDEKIVASFAGIMKTGGGLRSIQIMGVGEVVHAENAMIITDKHILFVFVPLAGADKVIGGVDIGIADWMLAQKDIAAKLNEMISSQSLDAIYKSSPENFGISLDAVKQIDFSGIQHKVSFVLNDGNQYSYTIRRSEDFDKLKQLFSKDQ